MRGNTAKALKRCAKITGEVHGLFLRQKYYAMRFVKWLLLFLSAPTSTEGASCSLNQLLETLPLCGTECRERRNLTMNRNKRSKVD